MNWLELPAVKWILPIPVLLAIAPVVWWFFRATWRELDAEALAVRRDLAARGEIDYRPMVALTLVTLHPDVPRVLRPARLLHARRSTASSTRTCARIRDRSSICSTTTSSTCGRGGGSRASPATLLPLAVWPLFFRRDSVLDFGLRGRGFRAHAWIYALCVVVMMPVLVLVSMQPDFADYYPMYKQAGRSWLDFAIWEIVYLAQFFTLELFFRGFIAARAAQLRGGRDLRRWPSRTA